MSRHTSYRGVTIDMSTIARENGDTPALGNMRVNAKGDIIGKKNTVIKTAEQIARESHKSKVAMIQGGLKGPVPAPLPSPIEATQKITKPVAATITKGKEKELPNGDIVVDDKKEADEE